MDFKKEIDARIKALENQIQIEEQELSDFKKSGESKSKYRKIAVYYSDIAILYNKLNVLKEIENA